MSSIILDVQWKMRRRHLHGLEVKIEFAHTIILLQCLNFCRCDYDHSDCEKAEWYVGEICNKVAYKQCCIDNQEEFGFCYDCYAQPGHHAGYSIEYLEGMLVKARYVHRKMTAHYKRLFI